MLPALLQLALLQLALLQLALLQLPLPLALVLSALPSVTPASPWLDPLL
jgi:hypothetical protein